MKAALQKAGRITCLFLLIQFQLSSGISARGWDQENLINVSVTDTPLKTVFDVIEEQTSARLMYDLEVVDDKERVSISVNNSTVEGLLKQLFCDKHLKWSQNGNVIRIRHEMKDLNNTTDSPLPVVQDTLLSITGTVTDTSGITLPGVSVTVKGKNIGVSTDMQGQYLLDNISKGAILVFSFLGYQTQEVTVTGQAQVNIMMKADVAGLDEVVVVGYGVQQKKTVTGAVASVDEEELRAVPTGNAASRLQGRVAGVTITNNHAPGGGTVVRIRGIGSINNNDPLYVVDGVPTSSLSGINPNDIESMVVLKDASSSAIYGSRAANGVIVITTKRGESDEPSLSFDVRYGVQQASNSLNLMNAREIGEFKWQKMKNDGLVPGSPGWGDLQYGNGEFPVIPDYIFPNGKMEGEVDESLYNFGNPYHGITKANKAGTDWYDEIFSSAPIQEYNLALSGGNKTTNYAVSAGYMDQSGILDYTGFKRYTLRSNSDLEIASWLKIGQSLSASYTDRTGNTGSGAIDYALRMHPIIPVYDIQGNFAGTQSKGTGNGQNPVAILFRDKDDFSRQMRLLSNVYGEVDLTDGLSFKTLLGVDYNTNRSKNRTLANPEFTQTNFNNSLTESHSGHFQYNWTNTLTFRKTIGEDHLINVLAGSEAISSKDEFFNAGRSSFAFPNPDYMVLDAGEKDMNNEGSFDQWMLFSYFGRLNYTYKGKYLLEGVIRRDGSSRFTEANRWGTFPAFSVGWRIIEEKFMEDITWLDDLKLRAGWGQNGNDNVGNYNAYSTYRSHGFESYYNISGASSNNSNAGFHKYKLGNEEGRWETNTTLNLGFDLAMFNYRLEASLDVYKRTTTDMLYPDSRPDTWGALELPSINIGEMENKGLDLILTYRSKAERDFSYSISANLSHYKNEVVKLNNNPTEVRYGNSLLNDVYTASVAGRPISSFYGYIVEGFFNTWEEVEAHPKYNPDINGIDAYSRPGAFRYKDVNKDGIITPDDRAFIGSPHPDLSYGLNLDFQYRNWDMTMFFQGVTGNEMINFVNRGILFNRYDGNYLKKRLYESWTPERYENGDKITVPITTNSDAELQKPSTYFVENASYFRMKNFQVGYTFPGQLLSGLNIERLRIYFQTTNLFTITEYSGLDPETSSGNDRHLGIDEGIYPTPRIFMFGINMNL